jgi:hypothetical protein
MTAVGDSSLGTSVGIPAKKTEWLAAKCQCQQPLILHALAQLGAAARSCGMG